MNAERAIPGRDVANTARVAITQARCEQDRAFVDDGIDRGLEFDEQHRITARSNPHASAASNLRWMPPKPPFDITTIKSPSTASFVTA